MLVLYRKESIAETGILKIKKFKIYAVSLRISFKPTNVTNVTNLLPMLLNTFEPIWFALNVLSPLAYKTGRIHISFIIFSLPKANTANMCWKENNFYLLNKNIIKYLFLMIPYQSRTHPHYNERHFTTNEHLPIHTHTYTSIQMRISHPAVHMHCSFWCEIFLQFQRLSNRISKRATSLGWKFKH